MIATPIIILAAAMLKALADTLDHHYETSIFANKPAWFWNPNVIHKTGPKIAGYPLDAWHIANSLQIACWLLLPFLYQRSGIDIGRQWLTDAVELCMGAVWHIVVFNIFYNKIFR